MTGTLFDLPPAGKPAGVAEWVPAGWPFGDLSPRAFGRIIADPPWAFDNYSAKGEERNPKAHYACLDLDTLKNLPVAQLADPEGCLLWLWATWPMLAQGLEVMAAWGFRYVSGFPWNKRTLAGGPVMGTGYVVRGTSEPVLLGVRGRPAYGPEIRRVRGCLDTCNDAAVLDGWFLDAKRREHSRKPDQQYAMLDLMVPHVAGAELFARTCWPGWRAWGNQTDRFAAPAAHGIDQ